jgi:two-component system nitrate/nitrite response regulator NarL
MGVSVDSADTVAAAMTKPSLPPRLVLLDVALPDGSGDQVLRHTRGAALPTKVCLLTGSVEPESLEWLDDLGADGCFTNPYHPERLLEWYVIQH